LPHGLLHTTMNFGFRDSQSFPMSREPLSSRTPEHRNVEMPKRLQSTISPLGYALVHMTTSHKTTVLFPSGLINTRARPLVNGTPEIRFPKSRFVSPLLLSRFWVSKHRNAGPLSSELPKFLEMPKPLLLFQWDPIQILSGFINARARPLVNGTPEFPMWTPFRDFPRNPGLLPRVLPQMDGPRRFTIS
jgi:hypothetical protein